MICLIRVTCATWVFFETQPRTHGSFKNTPVRAAPTADGLMGVFETQPRPHGSFKNTPVRAALTADGLMGVFETQPRPHGSFKNTPVRAALYCCGIMGVFETQPRAHKSSLKLPLVLCHALYWPAGLIIEHVMCRRASLPTLLAERLVEQGTRYFI